MNDTSGARSSGAAAPDAGAWVELKNARFVDVKKGALFDHDTRLMIRYGKIAAMPRHLESETAMAPDFVIDLQGRTVIPGLLNTHCHTTQVFPSLLPGLKEVKYYKHHARRQIEKNMTECLSHGITWLRDTWAADLRSIGDLRRRIQTKALAGPRIMQSVAVVPHGGYLAEKHDLGSRLTRWLMGVPVIDYRQRHSGTVAFAPTAGIQEVRDAVDRAIDERGAQYIKIGEQKVNMTNFKPDATVMTMNQLMAVADQAARRGRKSTIHHVTLASFRRALKAGVTSLAHVPGDGSLDDDDVALFLSSNGIIEPTLSVPYATSYRIKGHPTEDDPYLARLSDFRNRVHDRIVEEFWIPEFQHSVRDHHRKAHQGMFKILGLMPMKRLFENFASYCTTGIRNVERLFEGGACMTASNDGGVPPCTPAMVQHEMELLHLFLNSESGQDRFRGAQALQMATINAATSLGLHGSYGSIEVGKVADLVVMDGDPLQDHRLVGSRVAALFMDGKLTIDNCGLQAVAAGAPAPVP